ncbi:MAG: TlpA family protein disulfide reductase [Myxococcales bacterium]
MALSQGSTPAAFRLLTADRRPFQLAADRPRLLYFFKIHCPVCPIAAGPTQQLFEQLEGKAQVVPVSQDAPDHAIPWLLQQGLMAEPAFDDQGFSASRAFELITVPTGVLLDAGGRVAGVVEGWSRDGWNALAAKLGELGGVPVGPVSQPGDGKPAFRPG